MARELLIEEFHITVMVPKNMNVTSSRAIRRALNSRRIHAKLRRAVQGVFDRHTSLRQARILLGR